MKNKLFIILLLGLFSLFGANYAVAEGDGNIQENAAMLAEGVELIEGAIEHAKLGHAKETSDSINSSIGAMKRLVSVTLDRLVDKSKGKMRLAQYMCKRIIKDKPKETDSMEKVVGLLEEAHALLKEAQTLKP